MIIAMNIDDQVFVTHLTRRIAGAGDGPGKSAYSPPSNPILSQTP